MIEMWWGKNRILEIFPTAHIDVCIEQTSIEAVSGSHRSTTHIDGTRY